MSRRALAPRRPIVATGRYICSKNSAFPARKTPQLIRWRSASCRLARALAPSPDILLLDEPTNHLDLPGIEWLERELAGMRAGIVLISHDRRLLERISRTTVWLYRGITRILNEGFKAFEPWRDAVLEQEAGEQ